MNSRQIELMNKLARGWELYETIRTIAPVEHQRIWRESLRCDFSFDKLVGEKITQNTVKKSESIMDAIIEAGDELIPQHSTEREGASKIQVGK